MRTGSSLASPSLADFEASTSSGPSRSVFDWPADIPPSPALRPPEARMDLPSAPDPGGGASEASFAAEGLVSAYQAPVDEGFARTAGGGPGTGARALTLTAGAPDAQGVRTVSLLADGEGPAIKVSGRFTSDGELLEGSGQSEGARLRVSRSLSASLGVTSLAHAYVGLAVAERAQPSGLMGSAGDVVAFFGGRRTQDMPASGVADYAGAFEGVDVKMIPGQSFRGATEIEGDANLRVDFGKQAFSGRIDNVRTRGQPTKKADFGVAMRGSLQGSAFAGAAVLTRPGTTAPLFNVAQTGTTQGAFFGPGAAEAAGVLSAFARAGDASRLVAGVFGAKQR